MVISRSRSLSGNGVCHEGTWAPDRLPGRCVMARRSRRIPWMVLATLLMTVPNRAAANDACPPAKWARVVELSRDAKVLLDEFLFGDALARLQQAYALCPEPKLHRAMGRVHEAAGHVEEALAEFRACVARVDEEAARNECDQYARALEQRMAEAAAVLVLDGAPPDAVVTVDGAELPDDDREPIRVRPGRRVVEVRAEGMTPFRTEVEGVGGVETRIQVTMAPLPPTVAGEVPPPQPEPTTARLASALPSDPRRVSAFAPETAWNWVGIGTGAVATGLGIAFLVQYGLDLGAARDARYDAERDGWWAADEVGPRNLALGISFSAVGLAAVVTSAVLWPKARVGASAAPAPGGGYVVFTLGL